MTPISAVIITYNEETNIQRCLRSLCGVVDEIVVIDSFSMDATVSICEAHGARVVQHPFDGFGTQKQYGVSLAKHDMILAIDADEELSGDIRSFLFAIRQSKVAVPSAVSFLRWNFYCGKRMRYCLGNDYKVRMFDRKCANWTDNKVHEIVEVNDGVKVLKINTPLLHFTYGSEEEHERKVMKYAAVQHEEGCRANVLVAAVKAAFFFVRLFILKRGFLDGYLGFKVCSVGAKAVFKKWNG